MWHGLGFVFIDPGWKVRGNVGLNNMATRTFITPFLSVYDPEETWRHTARWAWRRHGEEHNEMESQAGKSIFVLGFSDSTVTLPSVFLESCKLSIHLLYRWLTSVMHVYMWLRSTGHGNVQVQIYTPVKIHLCLCGLFNDAVSSSDYIP
jgi:hypothetical protein